MSFEYKWRAGKRFTMEGPMGWDGIWSVERPDGSNALSCCVLRRGGRYFITKTTVCPEEEDVGPYETQEDAQIAAEVLFHMKGLPWVKK
jgi:hypothetical protein